MIYMYISIKYTEYLKKKQKQKNKLEAITLI